MNEILRMIVGHTPSLANLSGGWRKKYGIAKRLRADAYAATIDLRGKMQLPVLVTLTRVSPRQLDSDNLAAALKPVRDGIADGLLPANRRNQSKEWADDSDGQIEWRYEQRKGKSAVEFRIESKGAKSSG